MTDARDDGPDAAGHQARAAALIDAAQAAAGSGDHVQAERLLREAADIQESTLGESHPDLATTLNNLAFVCEQTGKFDDAERGYRRAHKIAVASLSPGHPLIKTSLTNLMEFCEARGIPIWTRPETPVEDEPLPDEVAVAPVGDGEGGFEPLDIEPAAIEFPPVMLREPAAASRLPLRMMAAAALVIAAIVVFAFAQRGQEASDEPRTAAHAGTTPEPPLPATPGPAADPVARAVSEVAPPTRPPAPEPPVAPAKTGPAPLNANASVTVLTAKLCSALTKKGSPDWQCTPVSADVGPGRYTFYTRILASSETRVEHRWYFDGRLHQTMRLRVSENPGSGYRTYSATTVTPERAGQWKVELRAADGTVLAQETLLVR